MAILACREVELAYLKAVIGERPVVAAYCPAAAAKPHAILTPRLPCYGYIGGSDASGTL